MMCHLDIADELSLFSVILLASFITLW